MKDNTVQTDISGKWVSINELPKFAEQCKQEVIDMITIVKSQGEVVAVTLTDEDHQIQRVIWQKDSETVDV